MPELVGYIVGPIPVQSTPQMRLAEALAIVRRSEHLRRTLRIALVVGTLLTVINQADVIVRGDATALTAVKIALNYCVPFIVSNLGLLAGKRAERDSEDDEMRPSRR